jgi:acetyl esterase/lipase
MKAFLYAAAAFVVLAPVAAAGGVASAGTTNGFIEAAKRSEESSTQPAVEHDIPYADGGDQQKLDLYLPAQKNFTTVVFTYGGGWRTGSRKGVAPIGVKLQNLGFGCALVSHRLSPKDKFPAHIEDVAAGFAWVKKHIAEKGGDPKRLFVMGHSSGAHLSMLLATDPQYLAKHDLKVSDIAGVIALSTPLDLEPRTDKKGFGDVMMKVGTADTFSRDVAVMKDASPIQHVTKSLPPTLLIVGDRDFPMLEGDAKAFATKASALGLRVPTFTAKGADHMGVVRSLLDEQSPVMKQVLAFLRDPKTPH